MAPAHVLTSSGIDRRSEPQDGFTGWRRVATIGLATVALAGVSICPFSTLNTPALLRTTPSLSGCPLFCL